MKPLKDVGCIKKKRQSNNKNNIIRRIKYNLLNYLPKYKRGPLVYWSYVFEFETYTRVIVHNKFNLAVYLTIFVSFARYIALGVREVRTNGNRHHIVLILLRRAKTDEPFFSPLRLMEMYGIVCLTTLLVTKTKAEGDPSRKTRKRVRRSTGLSILFPSFP